MTEAEPEQLALPGLPVPPGPSERGNRRHAPARGAIVIADELPIARVCVEVAPLHLDRLFDYLVPQEISADARPGTRVKVRFGAQDVDGIIIERVTSSSHDGRLIPIRRLVSDEVVLSPTVARLAREVADYYGGALWDVLRLAIPPRHARIEKAARREPKPAPGAPTCGQGPNPWSRYAGGEAFLKHLQAGNAPRAVWTALPGDWLATDESRPNKMPIAPGGWEDTLAHAVMAAVATERGALVVLPDSRDVTRLDAALRRLGMEPYDTGGGDFARLLAEDGPANRYRSFLAVLRGEVSVVIGTRAAAFAPVADLGLVICWQDGEQTHREPRAPHPHVREVLALRSSLEGCAFLVGSLGRSAEAQALLESGWAQEVAAERAVVRSAAARVRVLDSVELASQGPAAAARIPSPAWRAVRDALAAGPVLVQVPRKGYVPVLACQECREPARCSACHGPLGIPDSGSQLQCAWCGRLAGQWRCPECHGGRVRSVRVGSERTAEELGRAFPGVPVRVSGTASAAGVIDRVDSRPALVVATPGAEPVAVGGYSAALFLDAGVVTAGTDLEAGHRALLGWLSAASLVRPASAGGVVVIVGDGAGQVVGATVRLDPAGFAQRDLKEREDLMLPPAVRIGAVTGDRAGVASILEHLELGPHWRILGPVEISADSNSPAGAVRGPGVLDGLDERVVRAIVSAPRGQQRALARALKAAAATRSLKREGASGQVELDPAELI